jgi:hypothetical protein
VYINCKINFELPSSTTRIQICAVFALVNDELCPSVRLTGNRATSTLGRR